MTKTEPGDQILRTGFAVCGTTGTYEGHYSLDRLVEYIRGTSDRAHLKDMEKLNAERAVGTPENPSRGLVAGDENNLAEAGWGVIFAEKDPNARAIADMLEPLIALRREQAGDYFRIFEGETGYRESQTCEGFLANFGVGFGSVDPDNGVPYYLMLVGDPELIPFTFQYTLDIQYAVGRIYFENLEDYGHYARWSWDSLVGRSSGFLGANKAKRRGRRSPPVSTDTTDLA